MDSLIPVVGLCLLAWIAFTLHRAGGQMWAIRNDIVRVANTATMLFYAVEQVYEMSGVFEDSKRRRATNGESPTDASDSAMAWAALFDGMQSRMETTYGSQAIAAGMVEEPIQALRESDEEGDPDWTMLRENSRAWSLAVPMLVGWPKFPTQVLSGLEAQRVMGKMRAKEER